MWKPIPLGFLESKLKQLQKPTRYQHMIDLGHPFYLDRFDLDEDFKKTILGGPWFVVG